MSYSTFQDSKREIGILHLSDLHIGPNLRARESILDKIHEEDLAKIDISYEAVVVTGDLVESSLPSQYAQAHEYLLRLQKRIRVPFKHWAIIPGNHDVNFDPCKYRSLEHEPVAIKGRDLGIRGWVKGFQKRTPRAEELEKSKFSMERFDNYKQFLENFYGGNYSKEQIATFVEGGATITIPGSIPIVIGLLNSCKHVTEDNSSGYVEGAQLNRLSANFSKEDPENLALRIVALHHSFLPTSDPMEYVTNLDELRKSMENLNVRIILHGHRHVCSPDIVKRPWERAELVILPTGSAGLTTSVLGEIRNRYQVISFTEGGLLKVHMRVFEPSESAPSRQGVWCPDVAIAEDGFLQIPLNVSRRAQPSLTTTELTWDNAKLIASLRQVIGHVPKYVEVYSRSIIEPPHLIHPSILHPKCLGNIKRILLIGECGIGKSTTLRWLAQECLKKSQRRETRRIPIFFDMKFLSKKQSLWENIAGNLRSNLDSEDLHNLEVARNNGGIIFFLDSLDESASTQVFDEIDGLAALGNIVMVACRSSFYFLENMTPNLANFHKIEIDEWNYSQIVSLLREVLPSTCSDSDVESYSQRVPAWARSPLLVTLFYETFTYLEKFDFQTPQKSGLYERTIANAAAYTRDNVAVPILKANIRREILSEVAWRMFEKGECHLGTHVLKDVISKVTSTHMTLDEKTNRPDIWIDSPIISWLEDRISFRHVAFQEYLIAERILQLIRSGRPLQCKVIPQDETVAFLGELIRVDDLSKLVDWTLDNPHYWIVGLLSKFSTSLISVFASKLKHLSEKLDATDMRTACRLIWCTGELRLRSSDIRAYLEKIFEICNEAEADIAWDAAFAFEKIWAIEHLPHFALQKLVSKYYSATDAPLNSKLSCILSVAKYYGKRNHAFEVSKEQLCRIISESNFDDPSLYNALWIAGAMKIEEAVNPIIDLLATEPEHTGLSVHNCAVEALGKIANKSSLDALIIMLRHRSLRLRWRALEALSITDWGKQQLERSEFEASIGKILSQLDLVGSPFEKERIKETKRRLGIHV